MIYQFCRYSDGTEVSFSDIKKNNEIEIIYIHFERPTEEGFDSVRFELPSYDIVYREGKYSEEEIAMFKKIVESGAPFFYKWAKEGGIEIA